jgi:hypothetical protein
VAEPAAFARGGEEMARDRHSVWRWSLLLRFRGAHPGYSIQLLPCSS